MPYWRRLEKGEEREEGGLVRGSEKSVEVEDRDGGGGNASIRRGPPALISLLLATP